MRRCKTCLVELTKENSYSHQAKCKECVKANQRKYRLEHKEYANNYAKEYFQNHKTEFRKYGNKYKKKSRQKFLDLYGRVCACCGETNIEFLTIEHKLGQKGNTKKEFGTESYVKAIKEYRPDLYETLCYNCNLSKGRYGYCPHQKSSL